MADDLNCRCSELKEGKETQTGDEGENDDEEGSFSWLKEMGIQDKIKKPDSITMQLYPPAALCVLCVSVTRCLQLCIGNKQPVEAPSPPVIAVRKGRPCLWTTSRSPWCVWRDRTPSPSSTSSSTVRAWWLQRVPRRGSPQHCWPPGRLEEPRCRH